MKRWLQPALCGLALVGSVSLAQAQTAQDYIVGQFDDGAGLWSYNYGGTICTIEADPTENRGPTAPGATPGAMKVTIPFNACSDPRQIQSDFERVLGETLDLTKYTKLHFSVKVDPTSSRLSDWGAGAFGNMRPHIRLASWGGDVNLSTTGANEAQWVGADAYGNWVDYAKDIDQVQNGLETRQATGIIGIDIWSGWGTCAAPIGHTNTVVFWMDNIWFEFNTNTAPVPPPMIAPLQKAGPSGVEITMDTGDQWQRDAIVTPTTPGNCFWSGYGSTPVTYSFTIADFPEPVAHEGFEAHMYLVNEDTSGGNQTYGGADWNVPDIAIVSLQALTNGNYECQFLFKTNRPNNNPLNDPIHIPAILASSNVLGTWSLSFTDNTNATLSGPGGISTNFTIPAEAVLNNFSPATSFIQFGFHKNDNENNGHNNGVSGTFSRIKKTGGDFQFDDTFNGATFTNNYAWRKTSATAVNHVPIGTAWKLAWTLPAESYNPQSAPALAGPWTNAGATTTYQGAGKVTALIPTSALPAGNATYFRLIKRPFTKLQILLPGETAAPNTVSGKTGIPDAQTLGVPFNVTVNAVDDLWNRVNSTDTITITSTDTGATLPADAALGAGSKTYAVTLNTSGSWTVTASDVTDGTKTSATSSSIVIP